MFTARAMSSIATRRVKVPVTVAAAIAARYVSAARFLFSGSSCFAARNSSAAVLAATLFLTFVTALKLFGVF